MAEENSGVVLACVLAAGVRPSEAAVAPDAAMAESHGVGHATVLPLAGKTVVVTGTLAGMSRTEAEDWIRQHGGSPSGSVSRRTSFVVAGDNAGSKLERARELGVPVIDLSTLLSMGQTE